jgi:2-polyprenyl-6-methoxyphenol hydroxylase-like FAD-dependent oxidoreductase
MRVIVVGAGPVGCVTAIGLSRQGHAVTVVDRDPGAAPDGTWDRKGVMQFLAPHGFRPNVARALAALMPDVLATLVAEGCEPVGIPGMPADVTFLHARRSTFERGLRRALERESGVGWRTGHADELVVEGGRIAGLLVDGARFDADAVVVAAGRACRLGDVYRRHAEVVPSGMSYISRMYRARPGQEPLRSPFPLGANAPGYLTIVFPQDDATLSTLIVRRSADDVLAALRHAPLWDEVAPRIPNLAPFVDVARFEPITDVMAGSGLHNVYIGSLAADGLCPVEGLLFVGDSVMTTNPQGGRGISLGLEQVQELLRLFGTTADLREVALDFDAWCTVNMRPWYDDHVYWDETLLSRWAGADIDIDAKIPSDVVCAAADVDPSIQPAAMAYTGMTALPGVLDPFQDAARAVLLSGWRPARAVGPTRDELADVVRQHAA